MEISSHYYALLALCRIRGIKKEVAHKIAYASQFVDDAKINCLSSVDGFEIHNIATCHSYFKMRTYNFQAMLANTCAFHFIPGCEGETFTEKLICKENSSIVNQIIDEYIQDEPEIFGMLMHIYADTFAHQNFSGLLSKENDIEDLESENMLIFQDGYKSFKGIKTAFLNKFGNLKIVSRFIKEKDLDDLIPAYGHGQAEHCPNIPYLKWSFKYSADRCDTGIISIQKVDNVDRFKRAFLNIKDKVDLYLSHQSDFNDSSISGEDKEKMLKQFFGVLAKRESTPNKIKSWQKFLIENKMLDNQQDKSILTYDETLWINQLIKDYEYGTNLHEKRKVDNVSLVEGYENSSWLKYSVGVKNYKESLKQACLNQGVDLHYKNY